MRSTLLFLGLAFLLTLAGSAQQDSVLFKRTYKLNSGAAYSLAITMPGSKMPVAADVIVGIDEVSEDGATMTMRLSKLTAADQDIENGLPKLTTKVGPEGMPNEVGEKPGEELFLLLAALSLTPGRQIVPGEEFAVKWTSDSKQVSLAGKGKLLSLDRTAGTATVQWDLTLNVSNSGPEDISGKSTYSGEDFSLVSAKAEIKQGVYSGDLSIKRKPH